MTDPTEKPETDAAGTGNAGAAAKPAGAVAAAPAAAAPKEAKSKKAEKAEAPEATVVVTGPEQGRWRIGRKFTREPSSIALGDLKEGELEALQADPALHVQIVDAPH